VNIHVDDIGTIFEVIVEADGLPIDISAATTKEFCFKLPDGVLKTRAASFVTDGTDGKLQYLSVAGDLSIAGTYTLQTHVITPGEEFHTAVDTFVVLSNIC